jgi:hypothetical protein
MNLAADVLFDLADRCPPLARERFRKFEEAHSNASAMMGARLRELTELNTERRELEGREKVLRGTAFDRGYALANDAPQVVEIVRRLERVNASIERVTVLEDQCAALWHATGHPLRACRDWLSSGVPRGVTIVDHEPIDAAALRKKSESLFDAADRIQRRGRELAADLHRVRSAPHPSAERKQAAIQQVDALAELAVPNVFGSVAQGLPITFPTLNTQIDLHTSPRALGFLDQPDALGLLCWLHRDAMIAKLHIEIDLEAGANDALALSNTDREKQEATILNDLVENDRNEVALVELARRQKINIDFGTGTSPLALLGVDLVTASRSSPLSLVSKMIGE